MQRPVKPIVDELGGAGMNQEELQQSLAAVQGEIPVLPPHVSERIATRLPQCAAKIISTEPQRPEIGHGHVQWSMATVVWWGVLLKNNLTCKHGKSHSSNRETADGARP